MDFKTRRYKPSELQKQQLLDLVKSNWSNLHLASKSEKGEIWNEISETLNRSAVAKYQHKTMQQWRKCWSDRITKAKRRLFVLKRNRYLHTQNQNVTLAANAEELEIIQEYGDDLLDNHSIPGEIIEIDDDDDDDDDDDGGDDDDDDDDPDDNDIIYNDVSSKSKVKFNPIENSDNLDYDLELDTVDEDVSDDEDTYINAGQKSTFIEDDVLLEIDSDLDNIDQVIVDDNIDTSIIDDKPSTSTTEIMSFEPDNLDYDSVLDIETGISDTIEINDDDDDEDNGLCLDKPMTSTSLQHKTKNTIQNDKPMTSTSLQHKSKNTIQNDKPTSLQHKSKNTIQNDKPMASTSQQHKTKNTSQNGIAFSEIQNDAVDDIIFIEIQNDAVEIVSDDDDLAPTTEPDLISHISETQSKETKYTVETTPKKINSNNKVMHLRPIGKLLKTTIPAVDKNTIIVYKSNESSKQPINNIKIQNPNSTDVWCETIEQIEKTSHDFLGLNIAHLTMLKELSRILEIPLKDIYIILRKIKRNENTVFYKNQNRFSITSKNGHLCTKNILRYLPLIANYFNSYLKHSSVFIGAFCNIYHFAIGHEYLIKNDIDVIIFIFSIHIEKPVDSIRDYLTLSAKTKSNVLKYLISVTRNGLINFVSSGYGGHATDAEIVEYSSYYSTLKLRTNILLFDDFSQLVERIGFQIIRLSSINKKNIVRILKNYVNNFISQIESFIFLKSMKPVPLNEVQLLDDSIKIACALINFKNSELK